MINTRASKLIPSCGNLNRVGIALYSTIVRPYQKAYEHSSNWIPTQIVKFFVANYDYLYQTRLQFLAC